MICSLSRRMKNRGAPPSKECLVVCRDLAKALITAGAVLLICAVVIGLAKLAMALFA